MRAGFLLGTVWGDELVAPGILSCQVARFELRSRARPPSAFEDTRAGSSFERDPEEEAFLSSAHQSPLERRPSISQPCRVKGRKRRKRKHGWLWASLGDAGGCAGRRGCWVPGSEGRRLAATVRQSRLPEVAHRSRKPRVVDGRNRRARSWTPSPWLSPFERQGRSLSASCRARTLRKRSRRHPRTRSGRRPKKPASTPVLDARRGVRDYSRRRILRQQATE